MLLLSFLALLQQLLCPATTRPWGRGRTGPEAPSCAGRAGPKAPSCAGRNDRPGCGCSYACRYVPACGSQLSPVGPKCALWNPRSSRAAGQPQPSNLRGFKAPLVMSFVLSCKVATDTQVQFTTECTFASIVAARRDAIAGPPRGAQETPTLRNSRAQRRICRAPKRAAAMPQPRAPSAQLQHPIHMCTPAAAMPHGGML